MLSNRRFRKPPFIVRALRKMRVQVASMRLAPKASVPPLSKTAGVAPVMPVLGAHKAPHLPPVVPKPEQKPKVKKRRIWPYFFLLFIGLLAAAAWWVWQETRSYEKQAEFFAKLAAQLTYKVEPGASPANKIRFPHDSPYDERMGYANLPDFLTKLQAKDFTITAQARISPKMVEMADRGFFVTYREKNGVGLSILDCRQQPLFAARYPERFYADFETTPKLLIDSLLYIENRELLDPTYPKRNPAIEWDRLSKAVFDKSMNVIGGGHRSAGGSTLATQIEKYRHSAEGRTNSLTDIVN